MMLSLRTSPARSKPSAARLPNATGQNLTRATVTTTARPRAQRLVTLIAMVVLAARVACGEGECRLSGGGDFHAVTPHGCLVLNTKPPPDSLHLADPMQTHNASNAG